MTRVRDRHPRVSPPIYRPLVLSSGITGVTGVPGVPGSSQGGPHRGPRGSQAWNGLLAVSRRAAVCGVVIRRSVG
eukprot:4380730-Prymnesium_polylepis.1